MVFKHSKKELLDAYNCARNNKEQIQQSEMCGCFSCKNRFYSYQIDHWILTEEGDTALCPYCYIEAVLGEKSGHPITDEFLTAMNELWYAGDYDVGWESWFMRIH